MANIAPEHQEALLTAVMATLNTNSAKPTFKDKLKSRKFWVAAAGCVTGICGMIGCSDNVAAIIVFAVLELGSIIGYCIAEGTADTAHINMLLNTVSAILEMISGAREPGQSINHKSGDAPELDESNAAEAKKNRKH